MRYTQNGSAVAQLGLALNRQWNDKDGSKKEDVTFVDLTAFGKTAEIAGQYLKKGRQVLIEGRLKLDTWDDKQTGQKRSKLNVVVESLHLLSDGKRSEKTEEAPTEQQQFPKDDSDTVPF